ncbi:DUF3010 family protein [Flavobacteriales bacterium]|nr:DUF3010 family protein [Flavobacteriales bacterium]
MKTIGIEISNKKVIFIALEQRNGSFVNITGKRKSMELEDDRNGEELKSFMNELHSYFDSINPDKIGIVTRMTKGKFAASPISFKIEGLIQLYNKISIDFVTPQALTAYFKKNELPLPLDHKYQEKAMKMAVFLGK